MIYKTFITSSPYYDIELCVDFKPNSLTITAVDLFDMNKVLRRVEETLADILERSYPKNWKLIMLDEKYGQFLTMGSLQMMECCWKFNYEVTNSRTMLKITGLR